MHCNPLKCIYGKFIIPQRYVMCFMVFLGIVNSYTVRVCLSLALTKMILRPLKDNPDDIEGTVFLWSERQQGFILSSFFPGYVITHIPGGFLSDAFGGKHVLATGVFISGIISVLTPGATKVGDWYLLMIFRFIIGLCQGSMFPSVTALISKWVPQRERGTLATMVFTGPQFGSILCNMMTGALIDSFHSWEIVFYFWGSLAIIWYLFFLVMCFSEPATHPFLTDEERNMLNKEITATEKRTVPWKAMCTDKTVIAIIIGEIGHDWIFFLMVVQLPIYMSEVLHFDIKSNSYANSAPYFFMLICSIFCGIVTDKLVNSGKIKVINIRKINTTIGSVGPAICLIIVGYLGNNGFAIAAIFSLAMFLMGPFYPGLRVNVLDISKTFAGVVMAIVNGFGAIFYWPIPNISALLTPNNTIEEWRIVFWMISLGVITTNVIYTIFASCEQCQWDKV